MLGVDIRDPRTGAMYPAGHADSDDAVRTCSARRVPAPTVGRCGEQLRHLTAVHEPYGQGRTARSISQANRSLSLFGRYGWRDLNTFDQPRCRCRQAAGNGNIYARNKQLALGAPTLMGRSSLLEVRFGWSTTRRPARTRRPRRAGGLRRSPGCRPTRALRAGCSRSPSAAIRRPAPSAGDQSAMAVPDPVESEGELYVADGRQSLKAGYEFQRVNVEVQDVNPLYGLDSYTGQFSRPAGTAANNIYNLADFMLGLRSQYALSTLLVAEMRQRMHFTYLQDDVRVNDRLTVEPGLRYEYATPMWESEQPADELRSRLGRRCSLRRADRSADRTLVNPDRNNFAPRLGFAYTAASNTVVHGGGASATCTGTASAPRIFSRSMRRRSLAPWSIRPKPAAPTFRPTEQGYPAGITDPSKFNPLTCTSASSRPTTSLAA